MSEHQKIIGFTEAQEAVPNDIDPALLQRGYDYLEREKSISARHSLATHLPGVCFSVFLSLALVMEGFDGGIINSFFGQPNFQRRFGTRSSDGSYHITAQWQTALGNAANVGGIIGVFICGWAQEKFGSRRTYITGMIAMALSIFLAVFTQSLAMLVAAQVVMGVPWGLFQTLSTTYAAEITPINLRGALTSFVNICWAMGFLISSLVVYGSLYIEGDWAWRMPYVLQWIWPIPLAIGCYFAPESPWWLARRGRTEDAKTSLRRLARADHYAEDDLDALVAVMKNTNEIEKVESSSGSYADLFRGSNRRRTEIMVGVWLCQIWCGNWLTGLGG